MNWLARGLTSSVGLKFLMAVTGILLVLFVIGHMLGNLQVFLGPDALNTYAAKLQGLGGFLWVIRAGLLLVLAVHVATGVLLVLRNWSARPVGYADQQPLKSTFSSRTMIWTGLLVLVFLAYHLLHFTVKTTGFAVHAEDAAGRPDVHRMVIEAFQQPSVAISYVLAMIFLFLHLKHGVASIFQSLGWNHPKYEGFYTGLGKAVAAVLVVGNVAMPLLVFVGLVGLPAGGGGS